MSLRGLVIGLGNVGLDYDLVHDSADYVLTHSNALHVHPYFDLVGGCDINDAQNVKFYDKYKKPSFSTIKEALIKTKPDIVCVSVPTKNHHAVINEVFKIAKPKIILCEKPISDSLENGIRIKELCDENKCKLFINFMRKSDVGSIEVKKRIDNGEIISPMKGVCWYSKGLLNNGSHFINLLEFWLGEAESYKIINKGIKDISGDSEPDVKINFKHGEIFFLSKKEDLFSFYTMELIASNGRLKYEMNGSVSWQSKVKDDIFQKYTILDKNKSKIEDKMNYSQYYVLNEIKKNNENKKSVLCDSEEALRNLDFLNNIIEEI